jgi:hypothetical protein
MSQKLFSTQWRPLYTDISTDIWQQLRARFLSGPAKRKARHKINGSEDRKGAGLRKP